MVNVYRFAGKQLRLLISDVDTANQILDDDQIAGYLGMWGIDAEQEGAPLGSVKRAAADALDAIATSEVLVSKVIRTQDLSTDGSKTAAALRAHATALRTQADVEEDNTAGFDVIEFTPYPRGL